MSRLRVLVTGGRGYSNATRAAAVLARLHAQSPFAAIIHGGAAGADEIADRWARRHGVPVVRFDADWTAHGRKAGPLRNQRMIEEGCPDFVVAFPGGRGTADCVRRARRAGLPVVEVPD